MTPAVRLHHFSLILSLSLPSPPCSYMQIKFAPAVQNNFKVILIEGSPFHARWIKIQLRAAGSNVR